MDKSDRSDQQTGQCLTCGFLGKRMVRFFQMWPVFDADHRDRESGNLFTQPTSTGSHNDTEPFCFRHIADLSSEVKEKVADKAKWDSASYTLKQEAARAVIEKDRGCPAWFPFTPGFTPKDHLEDFKMQELEQRRREFEQGIEERRQAFERAARNTTSKVQSACKLLKILDRPQMKSLKVLSFVVLFDISQLKFCYKKGSYTQRRYLQSKISQPLFDALLIMRSIDDKLCPYMT